MRLLVAVLLLVACGGRSTEHDSAPACNHEPVELTITGHRSLRVSACIYVSELGASCAAAREGSPGCYPVADGERVVAWFPTDGFCASDGAIYPDGEVPDGAVFGLEYSYEPCP